MSRAARSRQPAEQRPLICPAAREGGSRERRAEGGRAEGGRAEGGRSEWRDPRAVRRGSRDALEAAARPAASPLSVRACPAHGRGGEERGHCCEGRREGRRREEGGREGRRREECSVHPSPHPSPHHYTYAVERAALLAREADTRPGSASSLASELSLTSGYASLPSPVGPRVRVPNCRSPPRREQSHDCISLTSSSGTSELSYLDYDRTSMLSGLAQLELQSPSYQMTESPLQRLRSLPRPSHQGVQTVQSQPGSPRHAHRTVRKATEPQRCRPPKLCRAELARAEETTAGCCAMPEHRDRDRGKPPLVTSTVKSLAAWVAEKAGQGTSALLEALPSVSNEDFHIVMIGLDGAGKTTALYRMKLEQYVHTVPTIGFNCERVRGSLGKSRGLTFLVWDVGGQERVRPLWRSYTRGTDGIIFVLDSADSETLDEARLELQRTMHYQDNSSCPLLVLANKQDLPGALNRGEVEQALGLDRIGDLVAVEPTCSVTGEGLDQAVERLHQLILKRKMRLKRNRNKTR